MLVNEQKTGKTSGAAGWFCRSLFLGTLCFYSSLTLDSALAHLRAEKAESAAQNMAALDAESAEYGTGGASYPADGVLPENASFESLVPVILEPEEYSSAQPIMYTSYKLKKGDMIGILAQDFGLNQDTLISVNGITNTRSIREGEMLRIPNQDGIAYTIKASDTLSGIAEKHGIGSGDILTVNEYFSTNIKSGDMLFIPGIRLDPTALQEINGDLFIWPTTNRYVTSAYGWRRSPITHTRLFHIGIDIRGSTGAPVYAAMAGRVTYTGYNEVYGNHIVVSHHSGYRTLYGHLNVIRVKSGAYVSTGQRIGDVGNTGASTGPHLHFTVYKNGVTVNPRILMN
jgi:murein DD-endopeptidase MepM/ murein hydrolase activator NlpD